jgi:radical SAM superfamily enzyme YgiQ (UPF0313 family)
MKALLVHPPFHSFFKYDRWGFPINCTQLAGDLKERGIEALVYDGDKYFPKDKETQERKEMIRRQSWYRDGLNNDGHYIWNHFRVTLEKEKPDVVGVTMWTSSYESGMKILQIAKQVNPDVKTAVGGYHATAMDKLKRDTFTKNNLVDCTFIGVSDKSFPDWILNGFKEKVIKTSPSERDATLLPAPDRSALLYPEFFTSDDMGMLMTSYGCPYDCTFCSNDLLTGRKYQFRTIGQVRKEIETIVRDYGVTNLNIPDANFLANRRRSFEMMELFKSFGLGWNAPGHVNSIDDEVVRKLVDCNISYLCMGIEAGTDERLTKLRKRSTISRIEKVAGMLNSAGVKWKAFFIAGWPDDTLEEMENLKQFALKINPSYISLNSFVPLPATAIYDENAGIFGSVDVSSYNQLSPKADFLKYMSPEEYERKFIELTEAFEEHNDLRAKLGANPHKL